MERVERLGRYALIQSDSAFKLGGDTLALGRFATVKRGWRVCDLGAGTGALGLLLLEREATLALIGIELDPTAADLCRRNYEENQISGVVAQGDLRDPALLAPGTFDLAVSNPPWFAQGRGTSGGGARCEETCTLDEVCAGAGYLLKNGGRFALVHRPERLSEVFAALLRHGMEPKRLAFVRHGGRGAPSAALVEAMKQGRPGLDIALDD